MHHPRDRHHPRGSSLVAVLWLMSMLALAVFAAVRVVSHDVDIVTSQIHGSRARQLAEMGIAVGVNPRVEPTDPILRRTFEDSDESYKVTVGPEAVRFNINTLVRGGPEGDGRQLLRDIFNDAWEYSLEETDALIDALVDWVDTNEQEELNGAENEYYTENGQPNFPFNRPFFDIEEMRLVRGMARLERHRPDWRNWFTVWGKEQGISVNDADPELIAAAAKTEVEFTERIPQVVRGPDGIRYTEDDEPYQSTAEALQAIGLSQGDIDLYSGRFAQNLSNLRTFRIESVGRVGTVKRKITVVVENRNAQPTLLQRKEEIIP